MKDAYSFHTSQEDLEQYYAKCYHAYERIFARAGIPETIVVQSDSGMMGGNISHEYMLLTAIGEDSIAICSDCGYSANMEAAESIIECLRDDESQPLEKVSTPGMPTIEEVCDFLKADAKKSLKAVVYQKNMTDEYVIVFIRGDLDVNETKLTNFLGENIHPAVITEESGINAGFIGPVNMDAACKPLILFDASVKGCNNLVTGANEVDFHFTGLDMTRDFPDAEYHDFAKIITGGICPNCGKHSITVSRGIEVGNIFQLGTKYTESMGMSYLDEKGETKTPIMGCYGIGVGRLAASVCEAHHDEYGPVWPMSIAPWQVHLCCMKSADEEAHAAADKMYDDLQNAGLEVIYDDRKVSAGFMFSDADLLGVPVRVIVSPRNLKENVCEVVTRDKTYSAKVPVEETVDTVKKLVAELMDKCKAE
jgi:prolyl-tRNA synthetase